MTICTPSVGDRAGQMVNEGEAKQEGCGVEIDKMDNHVGLRHEYEFSSKVPRMVRIKLISGRTKTMKGESSIPGVIAGTSGITNPAIANSLSRLRRYGTCTCPVANITALLAALEQDDEIHDL